MRTVTGTLWSAACLCTIMAVAYGGDPSDLNRAAKPPSRSTGEDVQRLYTLDEPVTSFVHTLPPDFVVHKHDPVVAGGRGPSAVASSVAGEVGVLIYSNTLGKSVQSPPSSNPTARIADDFTTVVEADCLLDRYVMRATGDPNGDGVTLGDFSITMGLYKACPGAGGQLIAGTQCTFENLGGTGVHELTCQIGALTSIPVPSSMYVGVNLSRVDAGVLIGAPPTLGTSADRFDFPGFPCSAGLGGFPAAPHASFFLEMYARDECVTDFVSYKATNHAGAAYSEGTNKYFADDIHLATQDCELIAYEVGIKGTGAVVMDLRSQLINADPVNGGLLNGTRFAEQHIGNNITIARKEFDPPIQLLQQDLFIVFRTNTSSVGPVFAGKVATAGSTDDFYCRHNGQDWICGDLDGNKWDSFEVTLYCAGRPPDGACCDMIFSDDAGEAECRELPRQNCAFPQLWREGSRCGPVCVGGDNNGVHCATDDDCTGGGDCIGSFCNGGENDGLACSRKADCPGSSCFAGGNAGAPCEIDDECPNSFCRRATCPDAFTHSCGVSACCTPEDECINLTRNECNNQAGEDEVVSYQRGLFCGEQGIDGTPQRCPLNACIGREGECALPRTATCRSGTDTGEVCDPEFNDCLGVCKGGDLDGEDCQFSCPGGGLCARSICEGGMFDGELCAASAGDLHCPGGHCNGPNCKGKPGCKDPFCCSDVCEIDARCCQVHWDQLCAATAAQVCTTRPGNDACYDPTEGKGAALVAVPGFGVANTITGTYNGLEPEFCCYEGLDHPVGSVWFKFVAPPAQPGETTSGVQVYTCNNDPPADDSIIQVFSVGQPDRGVCADRSICSVTGQDCLDGSGCVLDEETACQQLNPLSCSDNESTCRAGPSARPNNSQVCLPGLTPGEVYYVMVSAAVTDSMLGPVEHRGSYRVDFSPATCSNSRPLDNDWCQNAIPPEGQEEPENYPIVTPFDMSGDATHLPASLDCPGDTASLPLKNDIWYDWTAPCDGNVVISTCGGDDASTPDTSMCIYEGCECPIEPARRINCSDFLPSPCFLGSQLEFEVTAGTCYKIRLGGDQGNTPAGDLTTELACSAGCPEGPVTFVDPEDGTVDARQPFPPGNAADRQGIDELHVQGPEGIEKLECWSLCESEVENGQVPNTVTSVDIDGGGNYTVHLTRSISTGAATVVTYTADSAASFPAVLYSHPANVNGDSGAASTDILRIIDYLNNALVAPWGKYSEDLDHSGAFAPQDILREIDLLNGAGAFRSWIGSQLPDCGDCCP